MRDQKKFTVNHRGGVGEIGSICNHGVIQPGTIGKLCNHHMRNAAPQVASIVNHDLHGCSQEEELAKLLGVWLYPGRVLGSTRKEDIVQFHPDLKSGWDWITRHYRRIGLEHSENVIWDDSYKVAKDFPSYKLSPFFFGEMANEVRPDRERLEVVKAMNKKNEFIALAQSLGVPMPRTWLFESKNQVQDCKDFPFPCVLKISESVSGLGVVKCDSPESLEVELSGLAEGIAFQIQEYLENAVFPSVQYGISGNLLQIAETVNILEGAIHAGNWGGKPMVYRPSTITWPLALALWQMGMKGWFSFDTAYWQGKYYALECNPRYTGAAYPYNVAAKLGARFWIHKNYRASQKSLEDLNLGELEFGAGSRKKSDNGHEGWVLVNWGPLAVGDGKGGFLYIGKPEKFRKEEEKLMTLLA